MHIQELVFHMSMSLQKKLKVIGRNKSLQSANNSVRGLLFLAVPSLYIAGVTSAKVFWSRCTKVQLMTSSEFVIECKSSPPFLLESFANQLITRSYAQYSSKIIFSVTKHEFRFLSMLRACQKNNRGADAL